MKPPVEDRPLRRTVHVRVAVSVDADGNWNSDGCCDALNMGVPRTDADKAECAGDPLGSPQALYFLEADLPLPAKAIELQVVPERRTDER